MGGPDMAPHTHPRSGRPGEAVAPLDDAFRVRALLDDALRARAVTHLEAFERRALQADGRRPAAVAVVLVSDDAGRACFLLTRRAAGLRQHAKQWALPGGRLEPGESALEAARRELSEEVGLALGADAALGLLDDYPTRSGFLITPVVFWGGADPVLAPNPDEVASVHRVPLEDLDHPDVPRLVTIPESDRPVIQVPLLSTLVHAPTAAARRSLRAARVGMGVAMTFTLIDQGRASEVQASVEGGRVRLSADALRAALGWELHDGTLCNDAMCVPLPAGSRLGEGGVFDLGEVAATLDRPLALDADARAAYLGVSAGERTQTLGSLLAPDFTLPDLAGRPHTLSSYRGQKILLVAWASW